MAYIAARAMRWRDLLPTTGNRVLRVLIDGRSLDRRAWKAFGSIVLGTVAGLRRRRPLRPELSRLYRTTFPEFASPFIFMRGPRARLRARGDAERAEHDRLERLDAVFTRRAAYFPKETAALVV
jgi:hypothetical protein